MKRFTIGDESYPEDNYIYKCQWCDATSEDVWGGDIRDHETFTHNCSTCGWEGFDLHEHSMKEHRETYDASGLLGEVNTSYDQDQPIGDVPQALNTELSGSEPIDATTGKDFYTIQTGGEDPKIGEFRDVWKQLGYESHECKKRQ